MNFSDWTYVSTHFPLQFSCISWQLPRIVQWSVARDGVGENNVGCLPLSGECLHPYHSTGLTRPLSNARPTSTPSSSTPSSSVRSVCTYTTPYPIHPVATAGASFRTSLVDVVLSRSTHGHRRPAHPQIIRLQTPRASPDHIPRSVLPASFREPVAEPNSSESTAPRSAELRRSMTRDACHSAQRSSWTP